MKKLKILGRTNQEKKVYFKIKAELGSMDLVTKIAEEMEEDFFIDYDSLARKSKSYARWKDKWFSVSSTKFGADIVCGDKAIHFIVYRFPSLESLNRIMDKYSDFCTNK